MGLNLGALQAGGLLAEAARVGRVARAVEAQIGEPGLPLDSKIALLNQSLRPLSVLSVFALVGAAFYDPQRYSAGMAALAATPWPVWAISALVLVAHVVLRAGAPVAVTKG